ncbi:MAG: hypothetical protein Q8936_11715 [Bacillota bacterium]|nr:hypothetical protein [Bacillota bacterium]
MPGEPRKRQKNKYDKHAFATSPPVTGSFATSTSSNLTIHSAGTDEDPGEFFPYNNLVTKDKE